MIMEFFEETPQGYHVEFHNEIETAVDEYVQEEEGKPQQQDSPLNAPITLSQLKTPQD